MKKAFLTAAIILGGLSTYAISAVTVIKSDEIVMGVEEAYKEIKTSELPKAVLAALATDFNTATLEKAYVNAKQEYKLHISVQEVTSAVHDETVYTDKNGNWIVKERFFTPISNTTQLVTQYKR